MLVDILSISLALYNSFLQKDFSDNCPEYFLLKLPMGKAVVPIILNPLVKHELANLRKDPVRRRMAMNYLKKYVDQELDAKAIPSLFMHLSDTARRSQPSNQYVIALYDSVIRKHGSNIVAHDHVSMMMGTVVNALRLSGGDSNLGLQQTCAKLNKSAATKCLHAVVESESWKFAPGDLINEVCELTARSMEEKTTQTVGHMQLACSLAKNNGRVLQLYGRGLMKAGAEIFEAGVANGNWQQRLNAAQMINSLLKFMDTVILSLEVPKIIHVFEKQRLDRISAVRNAVAEGLHRAKLAMGSEKAMQYSMNDPKALEDINPLKHQAPLNTGSNIPSSAASSKHADFKENSHDHMEDVHVMPKKSMTADDFHVIATPRSLIQSSQYPSSPDSVSLEKQFMEKQYTDADYNQTSNVAEWSVRHNPIANDDDDGLMGKKHAGKLVVGLKGRILLDRIELLCSDEVYNRRNIAQEKEKKLQESYSVCSSGSETSETLSSTSSSDLFMENAERDETLPSRSGQAESHDDTADWRVNLQEQEKMLHTDFESWEGSVMSSRLHFYTSLWWSKFSRDEYSSLTVLSDSWKKARNSIEFILQGSLCALLFIPAAMVATKCFGMQEQYHVLLPT
eukprot:Gb_07597 [translate_table: standard]